MSTEKQLANLKRGGIQGTSESAARARDAKAALAAEAERIGEVAAADPHAAFDEMHAIMTRHTLKLLRAEERSSGKPSRDVTDRLREYRQLTEALAEHRTSRGETAEAAQFFATLDGRVEAIQSRIPCPNCGSPELRAKPTIG